MGFVLMRIFNKLQQNMTQKSQPIHKINELEMEVMIQYNEDEVNHDIGEELQQNMIKKSQPIHKINEPEMEVMIQYNEDEVNHDIDEDVGMKAKTSIDTHSTRMYYSHVPSCTHMHAQTEQY
jgi:hypothetical protein